MPPGHVYVELLAMESDALQTECVLIAFVTQCTLESQDRFDGMITLWSSH